MTINGRLQIDPQPTNVELKKIGPGTSGAVIVTFVHASRDLALARVTALLVLNPTATVRENIVEQLREAPIPTLFVEVTLP